MDHYESLQRLAGPVSRETFLALLDFEKNLLKWSSRINLVSASTLSDTWRRHILDSAQLLPLGGAATTWVDLGSGGGFPGAVLAILLRDRQDARIELVESNKKKAAFLKTVLGPSTHAQVHVIRAETAIGMLPRPQIVTARAFAPLPALLELLHPWLSSGSRGLFHKGREFRAEVEETSAEWRFDLVEHRSAIESDAVVLDIAGLQALRS